MSFARHLININYPPILRCDIVVLEVSCFVLMVITSECEYAFNGVRVCVVGEIEGERIVLKGSLLESIVEYWYNMVDAISFVS